MVFVSLMLGRSMEAMARRCFSAWKTYAGLL